MRRPLPFRAPLTLGLLLLAAASSGVVVTVAGVPAPTVGAVGEGGPANQAALNSAEDVEVAGNGDIYVADRNSQRLLRIRDDILEVAHRGDFGAGENDYSAVTLADDGTVYFTNGQAVLALAADGTVTEMAPLPQPGQANGPKLAVVASGLLVAQGRIPRIDLIAPDGTVTAFAGNDTPAAGPAEGDGDDPLAARFSSISDMTVDSEGNVFIADEGFGDVRKITPDGVVSTVFGNGTVPVNDVVDGTRAVDVDYRSAELGVGVDEHDRLYIVTRLGGRVFQIDGGAIITVAGGGPNPGDGSDPLDTQLQAPFRIAFSGDDLLILVEDGRFLLLAPGVAAAGGLVASVPSPADINLDPVVVATSIVLTAGMLFLVPFPAELFNNTLVEHHDEIRSWFSKKDRGAGPWMRWWAIAGGLVVMAVLCAFLDPGFIVGVGSLPTLLGLLAGVIATTFGFLLPSMVMRRFKTGEKGRLKLLPVAMVVAVVCVLVSRLAGFLPGYLYGIALGLVFASTVDETAEANEVTVSSLVLVLIAIASWFGLGAVRAGDQSAWSGVAEAALAMITVAAFEGLVFGLLPVQGMPGGILFRTRRVVWVVIWGLAVLAFFHVLVNPQSGYLVDTALVPTVTTYILLAVFALASVGLWWRFRPRPNRSVNAGHA